MGSNPNTSPIADDYSYCTMESKPNTSPIAEEAFIFTSLLSQFSLRRVKSLSEIKFISIAKSTFLGFDVLIAITLFSALTAFVKYGANENTVALLSASKLPAGFLGGFLSFALVFRTNICYSRWWEGRCLWGGLIYAAINTVQQGQCWICNEDQVRRLSSTVIVFAYACKAQLRGNLLREGDGSHLVRRGLLSREELDVATIQSGWEPYYFLDVMRAVISQASLCDGNTTNLMGGGFVAQLSLEKSIDSLARAIGGLIRVKLTGLPATYNVFFSASYCIFFLIATLAWAPSIGWYTPIVNGMIYILFRTFMSIGDSLEDPFGLDILDLPLDKYCAAIEKEINAVNSRRTLAPFDIGVGPTDTNPDNISQCTADTESIGTHTYRYTHLREI